MRKTIQILVFFSFSFCAYSQDSPPKLQKKLDSLWNIWEDNAQVDTLRLKAIGEFIENGYIYNKPDSAFYFAQLQYNLATQKNKKKYKYKSLTTQGRSLFNQGKFVNAKDYFTSGLNVAEDVKDKKSIAFIYNCLGGTYGEMHNYSKEIYCYTQSLKIVEELDDKGGKANVLNNIGRTYRNLGDNTKALDYFTQSHKLFEELNNKSGIAVSVGNIGSIHLARGNFDEGIGYLKQSLKYQEEVGNKIEIVYLLTIIANSYSGLGNHSDAMKYYEEGLKICEEAGISVSKAYILLKMGSYYFSIGDFKKSLSVTNTALELIKEKENIELQSYGYKILYNVYKSLGNSDKALVYHEQMLVLEDSLKTHEAAKKLQQMEFQQQVTKDSLEVVERERKLEQAHQEEIRQEEKNRNIAIASGIFFLLISGGLYGRWRYTKKAKAIIEKEKDRSENLLLNILPAEVAEELKEKGEAEARDYDMVSILFTDFQSFTEQSEQLSAAALVKEINSCFKAFDTICEKYNIEKIKTIGDAYMAAGGLPIPEDASVKNTVMAALEMQDFIVKQHNEKEAKGEHAFQMRVGVHTGPVVAGIVGVKKFQYDIWGDTVNTASRIESNGEVGKVNISEATYNYLKEDKEFVFESRGKVHAKGKGEIQMYFVALA